MHSVRSQQLYCVYSQLMLGLRQDRLELRFALLYPDHMLCDPSRQRLTVLRHIGQETSDGRGPQPVPDHLASSFDNVLLANSLSHLCQRQQFRLHLLQHCLRICQLIKLRPGQIVQGRHAGDKWVGTGNTSGGGSSFGRGTVHNSHFTYPLL
jgi:hypothetical protein